MSYCVNCGVELEKSCPACPLCDTPVINPRETITKAEKSVYPEDIIIPRSVNKKYWGFVISMAMLIPCLVTVISNMLFFENSAVKYVIGGVAVAWVWFVFPMLWKKFMPMLMVAIDAISLLVYLYTFNIFGDDSGWFNSIVLPVIIVLWAIINFFILWLRKPRSKSIITVAVFGAINIISFVVEICINMFYNNKLQVAASFIVTACCVSLMIFFAVLAKSKRLKAWVSRKFFV